MKTAMVVIAELGLLAVALWTPFRLGRAGIRTPLPMLAGWMALVAWAAIFGVWLFLKAIATHDHELLQVLPEGTHALLILLFGWVPASWLGAWGARLRKKKEAMKTLNEIIEAKQREVSRLPVNPVTLEALRSALASRGGLRDFAAALRKPRAGQIALIAEVKKASPSAGVICPDFDPVRIAKEYEAAGADCLSVLTDEKFFLGSLHDLRQIRAAVKLPLLRKDFIIDERQILEAIEWGADAILLIVKILDDARLQRFHSLATQAGLAALVEVHDDVELNRALAAGAQLLGVNNRDLDTFTVDLTVTERLANKLRRRKPREDYLLVAESGIHTRADVERVRKAGANAILVGESLMKQADIRAKVAELLSE